MANGERINGSAEVLQRLSRAESSLATGDRQGEKYRLGAPGARTGAWVIKVISLLSYNVYNVRAVQLGLPGTAPALMGAERQAVNVAEPFLQQGQLSAGTYAIMFRVGNKNAFYAPV